MIVSGFERFEACRHPTWFWSHEYDTVECLVASVHKCLWQACILFCFGGFAFLRQRNLLVQAMYNSR